MNNKKVLILAAHPDDEVLGCGGIIQKYKKESNSKVYVCIITDGSSTQYQKNIKIRKQKNEECQKANRLLGVNEIIRLDFPDMNLDTVPHFKLNLKIEEIVEKIKPNVLFTHSSIDINKDHFLINQSTAVITRPGKSYLEKIYEYEVLSSTEWQRDSAFIPNTYVNITSYIKKKIESFKQYKTEVRKYPHPRSPEGVKILARYRGLQSGYLFAEAFKLLMSYK
jgi:N-acetylglucosamine malate deacetylase 1